MRTIILSALIAGLLSGCGAGGMARAVTTAGQGFDRAECLADEFRSGDECNQGQFSPE